MSRRICSESVDAVASQGRDAAGRRGGRQIAGVVVLEDILKPGMQERFERLRKMGLRTVMITGDNPLTAATIAKQAGVDDFVAEARRRRSSPTSARSRPRASWSP